jgi:FtsH-binding integral membrane protein
MQLVAQQEKAIQVGFIRKVYGILTAQLLATVLIASPFVFFLPPQWAAEHQGLFIVSAIASLAIIIAGSCNPSLFKTYPQNYLFTALFTIFEAVTVGYVVSAYTADSVCMVFMLTMVVTGALSVYAYQTERDFTESGGYLLMALVCMICFGLLMMFFPAVPFLQKVYATCGALLFGGFIVYDTQMIIGGKHAIKFSVDDYVYAAINVYLDILNLFLYLLQLFGDRRN